MARSKKEKKRHHNEEEGNKRHYNEEEELMRKRIVDRHVVKQKKSKSNSTSLAAILAAAPPSFPWLFAQPKKIEPPMEEIEKDDAASFATTSTTLFQQTKAAPITDGVADDISANKM